MLNHFLEFRQDLYHFFSNRKDSLMNLIDSLAGSQNPTSVVRLSLEPTYPRSYSTISKAIDTVFNNHLQTSNKMTCILQENLPSCHFLVTDVTPLKRPFAQTLKERCFIYHPSSVKGQKSITIGHNYSFVCALAPEKKWVLPLSVERVKPTDVRSLVGVQQLEQILKNRPQKWIHMADTDYSNGSVLKKLTCLSCINIIRMRSNRVLYFPAKQSKQRGAGRRRIYGKKFYFKHPSKAHEEIVINQEEGDLKIERWNDLLIQDIRVKIDVVRIRLYKNRRLVFKHPIWLAIVGQKDISTSEIPNAYRRRFDIEHFLRFGKRRLLLNSFQTPKVESEENWIWISIISQWMLYFAKEYAASHPLPWEKKGRILLTPSLVQRDYGRIIKEIAEQPHFPKRRGNSIGRLPGTKLPKRRRYKVVKKWKFSIKQPQAPPKIAKNSY